MNTDMNATLHADIGSIAESDWNRCLPDEAENHAYYRTCTGPDHGPFPAAVTVSQGGQIIAVAPVMGLSYRLDTSLQGPLRRLTDWLAQWREALLRLDLIGLGSPLAERCHIGFDPDLSAPHRQAAFGVMMAALADHARKTSTGLVVIKDLAEPDQPLLAPVLEQLGYSRINSLPVAVLDLAGSEEAYLSSLSSATRKDIRRKLKKAAAVSIEAVTDIRPLADEIEALYEETRLNSPYDYDALETLPQGYFARLSEALGPRALFMLYRIEGQLAAFNLLLVEQGRVIDKFLGMRYPLGPDHNLYAVSWMANVRYCLAHQIPLLQTGQTAYASKLRFGSRLVGSALYFRHRQPLVNALLRLVAPLLAFDRQDPDLQALAKQEKAV